MSNTKDTLLAELKRRSKLLLDTLEKPDLKWVELEIAIDDMKTGLNHIEKLPDLFAERKSLRRLREEEATSP